MLWYSDINVRHTSLTEAFNTGFFRMLRENGYLPEDHAGGCVLYEKRDPVEALRAQSR